MNTIRCRRTLLAVTLSFALAAPAALAHPPRASDASAVSMLPIAVSVAAPVAILSAGAALTVLSVEATATGTVWLLERTSDGARASVTLVGRGVHDLGAAAGALVVVTAISTGWVLSVASEAIAFVPNEIGAALLYNERIAR